jgi:uncharacterized membrane protein YagU involved in acid resistance
MASEPHPGARPEGPNDVEMPRPTAAPLTVALGAALIGIGVATSLAFLVVGGIVLAIGLGIWVAELLPGRGHEREPLAGPAGRPAPVQPAPGTVEQLGPGVPGYRLRLPTAVHPTSAGVKGGLVGGLVMPVPALLYGLWSEHGIWYPVNLLAGMVLPGLGAMTDAELEQFSLTLLVVAVVIHLTMSVVFGLVYGVLLPTLPAIPNPLAWGGLLMPLLWTAVTFTLMGVVNPVLEQGVDWPWFIASQFVFGMAAAAVVMRAAGGGRLRAGLLGGAAGGLLMPVPALLWSLAAGRGLWYPVNLLAGLVVPGMDQLSAELSEFHADWLVAGLALHAVLSLGFGVAYALVLPKLPPISGPTAWGALVLPLVWTAFSYGLMGIANPVLQQRVDWPWFVVSQFVFGVAAAIVVARSELIHIPPAGRGPSQGTGRQGEVADS